MSVSKWRRDRAHMALFWGCLTKERDYDTDSRLLLQLIDQRHHSEDVEVRMMKGEAIERERERERVN